MTAPKIAGVLLSLASLAAFALPAEGGDFLDATREVGKTYRLDQGRSIHACIGVDSSCFDANAGYFTIDNVARELEHDLVQLHVALNDGRRGWIDYRAFVVHAFAPALQTSHQIVLGMTTDQIRAQWGNPDTSEPAPSGNTTLEKWTYKSGEIDLIFFEDGKVATFALRTSLAPQ